jgi:dihydrofolate reductase
VRYNRPRDAQVRLLLHPDGGGLEQHDDLPGDPVAAVRELKQRGDKHLVIYGYGQLAQTLLDHGLVDKLNFVVNPVMAGSGTTLFRSGKRTNLRLVSATERRNGVVTLSYANA